MKQLVIVRGGGDLATGIIHKLHRSGFSLLVLETKSPMAIRRKVCFSEAVYEGEWIVEGVRSIGAEGLQDIERIWNEGAIPVVVDPKGTWIEKLSPFAVVDAIVAKKNLGTYKQMAPITIGLGPGFYAGRDVHAVIETMRGHDLGRIIYEGEAAQNTGIPGNIGGYGKERVLYSPCEGTIACYRQIGDMVHKEEVIASIGDVAIKATVDGLLRGIIRNETYVRAHLKIADIDPRVEEEKNCCRISDKSRCIAGGVLEAILHHIDSV